MSTPLLASFACLMLVPFSYLGKSTGAGSLSLWVHNLKEIKYLSAFRSKRYSGKAFQVGAGVTVQEIYRAADAHNVTVLGGICEVSYQAYKFALNANLNSSWLDLQAVMSKVSAHPHVCD